MSALFEKSIRTLELPRVLQLLSEQAISVEAKEKALPSLRQVINATGVTLHTNLGRSCLSEAAAKAAYDIEAACITGIELCAFAAVFQIDLIHIMHQIQGLFFADILVQGAAKVIGDIIFSIGECRIIIYIQSGGISVTAVDNDFEVFRQCRRSTGKFLCEKLNNK